jgi:TonB family protein
MRQLPGGIRRPFFNWQLQDVSLIRKVTESAANGCNGGSVKWSRWDALVAETRRNVEGDHEIQALSQDRCISIGLLLRKPGPSEAPDLPPKDVLKVPEANPEAAATVIGKSWTPAQQQIMTDVTNRMSDRMCDVVDEVLKPYWLADASIRRVEWSVRISFWFDPAGRATRVTFDGSTTKQDLDRSLLSSMQRFDLKRDIPSWLPMPVKTAIGHKKNNMIGGCRLKHLRSA